MATNECPPNSKKSSSTPTSSRPNTSHQIAATATSTGDRGATSTDPTDGRADPGNGNDARSSFPFAVRGNEPTTTTRPGTMNSGNNAPTNRRTSRGTTSPTT